ncbi:SEC-C domain-containing protein [Paenibacillus sp. N4]|uniref:YecA family protein n=1 Tax=Paenibacillus vietnamensis TaxID=2590547 RepID=UPI001CD0E412|nr:SEC-C metal-binding domain-containing protein [Paenibacillus vietnamensis]MCA0758724.1 SEC-C domain-containing protein [Paenibacillus vietnamensis]
MTTKLDKMTEKFWPELTYPLSFTEALAPLTKQQLTSIRMNLSIGSLSTLNKQGLAEKLAETIAGHLWTTIRCWDHTRMKLVQKIAKNGGIWDKPELEIQQYEYFRERGILFPGSVNGKQVVVMPSGLVELFQAGELFQDHALVDRNTEWIKLIRGLLFYYGTLSNEELNRFLFEHTGNSLQPSDLNDILTEAGDYYEEIDLSEKTFVSDSRVADPPAIRKERALRNELDYRPFTRQQLLKAGEPEFVERDSHYANLVRFVLERYEIDRDEADFMAEVCVDAAKNGASLHEVLEEAANFIEMPGMETLNAVTDLLVPLMNNTRQYAIKGYSPAELSAKRASASLVMNAPAGAAAVSSNVIDINTKKKVGRNDPCPCGSSKKYKKCCG